MAQLLELTGASMLTIRRAVESLQDRKVLRAVGQDPDHKGKGRPPMLFEKISS